MARFLRAGSSQSYLQDEKVTIVTNEKVAKQRWKPVPAPEIYEKVGCIELKLLHLSHRTSGACKHRSSQR